MEPALLHAFQRQASLQCKFFMLAARDVNCAGASRDIIRTFYALQNLLGAAANIAKTLWGASGRFDKERKPLRDSIGIDDQSPLKDVAMRNNFEHFDERIDYWWKESKRRNTVDLNLGPANAIGGIEDIDRFRQFDPATTTLSFSGDAFNIQKLVDEVRVIAPKLAELASRFPSGRSRGLAPPLVP